MSHACHRFWKCYKIFTFLLTFDKVHNPLRLPRESDIWTSKSGREPLVFCKHVDFEMCLAPQQRALFRHLNFQKWSEGEGVFKLFRLHMCFAPQRRALFRHLNFQKWSGAWCAFVHFDFEMCFGPQQRALFRHRNFQKWSGAGVFCRFWLRNVLRATTACNCSSLIWPAGSAPTALASLLVDPPEPQIIGKNTVLRDFPTFSRTWIFFLWFFLFSDLLSSTLLFSLTLPVSAFNLSILSEVWLLNFLQLIIYFVDIWLMR